MNKTVLMLGIPLCISLAVNILILTRRPEPKPLPRRVSAPTPAEKRDRPTEEVVRPRVEAPRPEAKFAPAPPVQTAAPAPPTNPRVAALLATGEEITKFQMDLAKISSARLTMETKEYEEVVADFIADHLQLQGANRGPFLEALREIPGELKRTQEEYQTAMKNMNQDPKNAQAYMQQYQEISKKYQQGDKFVKERMKPYLDMSNARHKVFITNMHTFMYYLYPNYQNMGYVGAGE